LHYELRVDGKPTNPEDAGVLAEVALQGEHADPGAGRVDRAERFVAE
jgi:hypothetical protein